MTTKNTQEPITLQWLLGRGWTLTESAECIGRSVSHVRRVLNGETAGKPTLDALKNLPPKKLTRMRRVKS